MPGTKAGGMKQDKVMREKLGEEGYKAWRTRVGYLGGTAETENTSRKGFGHPNNKGLASEAGRKGGANSRRGLRGN